MVNRRTATRIAMQSHPAHALQDGLPGDQIECTESIDNKVEDGSASVRACTTCAMHSVPAHVDKAYWNGAVARCQLLGYAGDESPDHIPCHNASDPSTGFL